MYRKAWYLTLVFTCCSACVFGAGNKHKRSQGPSLWFQERETHVGNQLSDEDLKKVAELGDEKHFFDTLKPILIPRVVGSSGHTTVKEFIVNQMKLLGWTVEEHNFEDETPFGSMPFTNVITTLKPSATRRLVIACHYDSKLTPNGFLGAIDSAVPCAMMINLAYVMKNHLQELNKKSSDLTLQFIFFDGEEALKKWSKTDSLYGARKLSEKWRKTPFPLGRTHNTTELHRIDLFVLLDLIGTEDTAFSSYFKDSQRWYSALATFEKKMLQLKYINEREAIFRSWKYYGAGIEDDHIPFLRKGVPILHLISAPFPSVWHNMADNFDSLHHPTIENLNTILRAFVAHYLHLTLLL